MGRLCFGAALVLAATLLASAQDFAGTEKNEVAGTLGRTFISDQSVLNSGVPNPVLTHGAGLSFEVNYARILRAYDWADLAVEVPAIFNLDQDLHFSSDQIAEGYRSIFITPAARVRFFPYTGFAPWVSFGGGFGHLQASSNLLFSGTNTADRGKNSGVVQFGGGFDVGIPRHLENMRLRLEVRDNWSAVPPLNVDTGQTRQHNYYVAGGVAYRF